MIQRLDKEKFISIIEKIPIDLLQRAYAFSWDNTSGYQIQMNYASDLIVKYKPDNAIVLESGYTEWSIMVDETKIIIIMT